MNGKFEASLYLHIMDLMTPVYKYPFVKLYFYLLGEFRLGTKHPLPVSGRAPAGPPTPVPLWV